MTNIWVLGGFFLVCFAAAATGAVFQPGIWYDELRKPSWQPPKWLFPIAWSILYAMIAIAGWLAWTHSGFRAAPLAFALYALQLVLNAAWSPAFFGIKRMDIAFVIALAMAASITATCWAFAGISPLAAWLLAPYLAWVCFAAFLNWTVWQLNPSSSVPGFSRVTPPAGSP